MEETLLLVPVPNEWRSFVALMEREGIIGKCHRTECFFGGRMRQSIPHYSMYAGYSLEQCRRLLRRAHFWTLTTYTTTTTTAKTRLLVIAKRWGGMQCCGGSQDVLLVAGIAARPPPRYKPWRYQEFFAIILTKSDTFCYSNVYQVSDGGCWLFDWMTGLD